MTANAGERVWDADASCGAEFELVYPPLGVVVATCELEPGHDGPCALSDRSRGARARAERWEWIARRLLVLGEYGMGTDLFAGHLDERDFLTDDWLRGWYGAPLENYLIASLHEADAMVARD